MHIAGADVAMSAEHLASARQSSAHVNYTRPQSCKKERKRTPILPEKARFFELNGRFTVARRLSDHSRHGDHDAGHVRKHTWRYYDTAGSICVSSLSSSSLLSSSLSLSASIVVSRRRSPSSSTSVISTPRHRLCLRYLNHT